MDAQKVSQMTQYRRDHPEYYEAEKKRNLERLNARYRSDPVHRQRVLDYTRDRYADPDVKRAKQAYKKQYNERKKLAKLTTSFQNVEIAGR